MNKMISMILAALLLALTLLSGCPDNSGAGKNSQTAAVADDPHAGHDHGDEAEPEVEEVDEHAGHDHGDEVEPEPEEVDEHAGHDHEDEVEGGTEEPAGIFFSDQQISELGIVSALAGPGKLGRELELTGEIAINEDAVTHISPRVGGIISKVYRTLGDEVKVGTPLLELDSIELAEVKSGFLALQSRIELALQTMEREKMLLDKGISAEADYLEARQAWEQELISKRAVEQQLSAMGLSDSQIKGLANHSDSNLTAYTVYSPVKGEIIEKHASVGEAVEFGTEVFTVGDMSTVWVKLNIYQQDFLDVMEGMDILVDAGHGIEPIAGKISYIEPLIGEETRTAVARVLLPRTSHAFRPGLFVTGYLEVGGESVGLVVPCNSVVELDQDKLVFVRTGNSFEPRVVRLGRQTATSIEILAGLSPGEEIVTAGAFQLKAELLKGTFDPHAGHAH